MTSAQNKDQPVNLCSIVIPAFHTWLAGLEDDPDANQKSHHSFLKQLNIY